MALAPFGKLVFTKDVPSLVSLF